MVALPPCSRKPAGRAPARAATPSSSTSRRARYLCGTRRLQARRTRLPLIHAPECIGSLGVKSPAPCPFWYTNSRDQAIRVAREYVSVEGIGHRPRLFDVASDLRLQLVYAGELFLPAYPTCEAHVNDTPVQIAFKVKQVSLDTALCPPERGGHTDVGARGKLFVPGQHEPGVDAARRNHGFRVGDYVRGRKPYCSPSPVPHHDLSPEHVGTAKEACSLIHPSFGDERPDAGGADPGLLGNPSHLDRDGLPPHLLHESPEVLYVADCPMPEAEVLADHDDRGPQLPDQHVAHELLGTFPGQVPIERYLHNLVGTVTA